MTLQSSGAGGRQGNFIVQQSFGASTGEQAKPSDQILYRSGIRCFG
jgi:hypothetical protein